LAHQGDGHHVHLRDAGRNLSHDVAIPPDFRHSTCIVGKYYRETSTLDCGCGKLAASVNDRGGNRDEAADFVRAGAGKLKPGDPFVTGLFR
jgi:hypothetical protein